MTPALAPAQLNGRADSRDRAAQPGAPLTGLAGLGERRIEGTASAVHGAPIEGNAPTVHGAPINGSAPTVHGAPNEGSGSVVRHTARALHEVCADLLPGYAEASREPWRQAVLTAGCLDGPPVRPAPRAPAPPLIVDDVVQPSDVLCALWLARRSGLFSAGSACGDAIGRRSACEIVPSFAPGVSERSRDAVWEVLRANTAWRAHRAARMAA